MLRSANHHAKQFNVNSIIPKNNVSYVTGLYTVRSRHNIMGNLASRV